MDSTEEGQELFRTTIDFVALEQYQDTEHDMLPIISFVGIYRQCGIFDFIEEYYKSHGMEEGTFTYMENIFAHPQTIVEMKHLIQRCWGSFDITINEKGVHWKDGYNNTRDRHRVKELNKTVQRALNRDFLEYCPGADPTIPEGILVIRDKPVEESVEVVEDPQGVTAQEVVEE